MAGRPWIKLHTRWLTSPAHADLSGEVLATGVILMLLVADQGEDDDCGGRWLPHRPDHRATTAQDVVGTWLRRGRVRVDTGRRHVQALVKAGSFAIDAQGRLGMPNWLKWQEHPSSKRVRKHRAESVTVTGEVEEEVEEEVDVDGARECVTDKDELHDRAAQIPTRGSQLAAGLSDLAIWRTYGNDPTGLGQWPEPQPPTGPKLRRLTTHKVSALLADCTATEVHEFVHALSQAVEGGGFPPDKYTSNYVFDPRTFPSVRAQVDAWHAEQKRKAAEAEQAALSAPAQLSPEDRAKLVF